MAGRDLPARIASRLSLVGVNAASGLLDALAVYLDLLARWNRTINLTALDVGLPSDDAVDRLIVEPLVAAGQVMATDRVAIDIGSGGGSPAIPLKLAIPALQFVLVESKGRKSAFLREAVRQLGLTDVEVENQRFEDLLAGRDLRNAMDLVTLRAVRIDRQLLEGIEVVLRAQGRVFCFSNETGSLPRGVSSLSERVAVPLIPFLGTKLVVLQKA